MRVRPTLAAAVLATLLVGGEAASGAGPSPRPPVGPLAELRKTFTLHGKPVPPEVFRDLGDGDLADSGSIWVTIDLLAAIGSNLYADDIKQQGKWVSQVKPGHAPENLTEETAYRFVGTTQNGLLVTIATYNGGGSGTFTTLHILDSASANAFDDDGKTYQRIDLTAVRSVVLGDRWNGDVTISGNTIAITTTGGVPPAQQRKPTARTIEARRP